MIRNWLITLVSGIALVACASGPLLNGEPVRVESNDLGQYWIPGEGGERKQRTLQRTNMQTGELGECFEIISSFNAQVADADGYIVYEYLIDSNGQRSNEEVVEKSEGGIVEEITPMLTTLTRNVLLPGRETFQAAITNFAMTPVITRETIYLQSGTEVCEQKAEAGDTTDEA